MIPSRLLSFVFVASFSMSAWAQSLYNVDFASAPLGKLPAGWKDLGIERASPNWGVDGNGSARVLWKDENGLLAYEGVLGSGKPGSTFVDGTISALFRKTPDADVVFGLFGRLQDAKNYYGVRVKGEDTIELFKVKEGAEELLGQWVTRDRLTQNDEWTLSLAFEGPRITARLKDAKGAEQARVDALEKEGFTKGATGLLATNFAAVKTFSIDGIKPLESPLTAAQIEKKNAGQAPDVMDYKILKASGDVEKLNTPFARLADSYDVIVAGAGTSGWAAAVQAARLGAKVLLLEETDWIGGQMAAAAVATMDEEGCWEKFPVRERGIYREFNESIVNYYYTLNKDPFRAYYAWPEQLEGGYEPKVARAVLYGFIEELRKEGKTLDLAVGTRVSKVLKKGDAVEGVEARHGESKKNIACKVLVEATEYGDVLPLAGARYRVGNVTSDNLDPESIIQYHTWVGVIREYPNGVPDHLKMKEPPPGYDKKKYLGSQLYGPVIWGSAGKDVKGPRSYRVMFAWRGMADSDSPMTGSPTKQRHTQCGLNGGRQDYPVTVKSIEDLDARKEGERDGVYRTLGEIYYFQNELGLNWAVAEDEGYNTPHNQQTMKDLKLREDLLPIAVHLPQWPYVREARRAHGLYTLRANDLGRFEKARLFPTSIAMGDYFMDLDHGPTAHAVETDLDSGEPPRGGGPFQVPFEVFIPEKVDGLVLAEKNISQSRLVNGATRLQPITMLNGQAAGTIAALAVKEGIQPRQVNPLAVQEVQLASGSNLIQRWYDDVKWGTPVWRATQLLSLYQVMDPPGPFVKKHGVTMGAGQFWKVDEALNARDFAAAVARLAELTGKPAPSVAANAPTWADVDKALTSLDPAWRKKVEGLKIGESQPVKRGDFAQAAAAVLTASGKPTLLSDAKP